MIFNIGGSKASSSSQSESSSSSFDNMDASSFDFGMNSSRSGGSSSSSSRIAFEDIFAQMFGGAAGAAAGIDTGVTSSAANMLFSSGLGFIDELGGGGAGRDFLAGQMNDSGEIVDSQIDQLGTDIGKFLSDKVNPAIKSSGIQAGSLGGSRGEVQRGMAADSALQEFVRGSTGIRASERDRMTGIASGIMGSDAARNQSALSMLPSLFGLAESGAMASLSPFAMLSQILGPQTVLTDSESSQLAESLGINMGGSSTVGRAASESSSTSSSESSSMSFSGGMGK